MTDIAFLILAHKNEHQLKRLVRHLSRDFSVYLNIDSKSGIDPRAIANAHVMKSRVVWGSFSFIKAIVSLLSEASRREHDRFVLISGQDLPLVSNHDISAFFAEADGEYIAWERLPRPCWKPKGGYDRLEVFWEKVSAPHTVQRVAQSIRAYQTRHDRYRRLRYDYYGGTNWFNITNDCAKYILEYILKIDKEYIKTFRWTRAADEIIFQTILLNSRYASRCINSSLRFIDWDTGPEYPRIFKYSDLDRLMASKELLARKFDDEVDGSIIDAVYERVGE